MVLRITIICLIVSLTGCAIPNNNVLYNPPAQIMSHDDLNFFKYDCEHAAEQTVFLKNQLQNISKFDLNNPDRAIIQYLLLQISNNCEPQDNHPTGCVNVREDMKNGSANATVCYDGHGLGPLEPPVINHWDPLVDMK